MTYNGDGGDLQPPVEGDFLAFSAYYTTVNYLCTYSKEPCAASEFGFNVSVAELMNRTDALCSLTWAELVAASPGVCYITRVCVCA